MPFAAPEIVQTYWAIPVGALYFVAPGYLLASATDFFGFRRRSRRERILWSVALSTPLSLVLAQLLGREIGSAKTLGCFLLLALAAVVLRLVRRKSPRAEALDNVSDDGGAWIWGIPVVLAILLPLATVDIQVGHRLFQSTVAYDWAVRVPLVRSAIESGVPPANPLSALTGHAAPLHYYYFWYVLVGQLCRVAHVDARAGLAASTVWAAFDFLAVLLLCLKYFAGVRERWGATCLTVLLAAGVMGLDLIPASLMMLAPDFGVNIEMEWWHPDRSPSWLSSFLYAPHHIAGIASCMIGFLAVVSCIAREGKAVPKRWGPWLGATVIAGVCFGAVAGTSTFVALIFSVVCLLWTIRALVKREWLTIACLAIVAVIAVALTSSFLREMSTSAGAAASTASHPLLKFAVRNDQFVVHTLAKHHIAAENHLIRSYVLRVLGIVMLTFAEFGFFVFVFDHQLRRDFVQRRTLTVTEQGLWTVLCGAGLIAFFVSSGTDGPNDLGMHAGMILKFVLLLWAAPWIRNLYQRRHEFAAASFSSKLAVAAGTALFALGLAGTAYQLLLERTLFALEETHIIHKKMDTYPVEGLSYRLYDVRDAYRQAARLLPADSLLQFNPTSALQPAFGLYATRQLVAADLKCGTPFGGNERLCYQVYDTIQSVFGNAGSDQSEDKRTPVIATVEDLDAMCGQFSIDAVLASSVDAAWAQPDSWVWTRKPMYANNSVRLIPCGAGARSRTQ